MINLSFDIFQNKNAERKAKILLSLLKDNEMVLDFGCGDQTMSYTLWKLNKSLRITGIDVIDFDHHYPSIKFNKFDGNKIPYHEKSFDVVIAYHVFHHTPDPASALSECARVARRVVIFVEPVYRNIVEIPGMMLMDWLFNVWKSRDVSMSFTFRSRVWWEEQITKHNGRLRVVQDIEILPSIFPTGRSLLFVFEKN